MKITDALGNINRFTYNANGSLLSVTNPLNQITTLTYNTFGDLTSVTDPLNNTTTFAYDTQGNLITTTDHLGNQAQRVYDAVGRLVSLADPRGFSTQFRYDDLNRLTTFADARHGLTSLTYDPNGNLLTVTDAKGQTITYTYDNMDRLISRMDALGRTERYEYDKAGNLTKFTDRKGQSTTFTYDAQNRRVGATYADGSSTTFTYDSVGRLASITDSLSGTIQFVYDILDRLIQEIAPQGSIQYTYDALGRRTSMTVSGQQPITYQYDVASHLTQVAQGSLAVTIGYDAAGRRTSLTYSNGVQTTYTYDAASRLTSIVHAKGASIIESVSYAYDAAGNRISANRTGVAATNLPETAQASYDAANEQIQFNTATLTYDANGSLTSDGTNVYTWDARNRLVAISGSVNASFVYDPLGRRISKTINGVTTKYLYDVDDIVAEIQGGAVSATYLRSLNIDEPFARQISTGTEFYHTDVLGSTIKLTNETGTAMTTYDYEPFGRTMMMTGTSTNPFQFTGRENDGIGLYFYRMRYYSPMLQRFLSEDALGLSGGDINFYAYVLGNPVNYVDPRGLRVDYGNFVLGNPHVVANLQRLNQQIVNQGIPDDQFVLKVTGGDRYINTDDGLLKSLTDNSFVPSRPGEDPTRSPHLRENGARAVDLRVINVSQAVLDKALKKTDFLPANTRRDYPDGHVHIALPNAQKFYYQPWKR